MKTNLSKEEILKQQKMLEEAMDEIQDIIPPDPDPDVEMIEDDEDIEEEDEKEPEDEVSFAEKYYDQVDKDHAEILEKCAVICRSDKTGFTDETRLDAIRELLKESEYKETFTGHASMWTRGEIDPSREVILISSHADTVQAIKNPSSKLSDSGYYKGTYDNIGTNAAAVICMLEGKLPDNVVFAFTSEEETGRFKGIKSAVETLEEAGVRNPVCIALDVTFDGFDNGSLYTIENASKDKEFLNRLKDAAFMSEPENQTFTFVRKTKKAYPEDLDKKYISVSMGDCDEAFGYDAMGLLTCSLCLPCYGQMHADSGVSIRQPVFEGYVASLECMGYALTNTHPELLEAKKIEKQTLSERCQELVEKEEKAAAKERAKYNYTQFSGYGGYGGYGSEEYAYGRYSQEDYEDTANYIRSHSYGYNSYEGVDDIDQIAEELTDEYRDNAISDSYESTDCYIGPQCDKSDQKAFVADMMRTYFPGLTNMYETLKESFKEVYLDAKEVYQKYDQEEEYDDGAYGGYVDDLEDVDDLE